MRNLFNIIVILLVAAWSILFIGYGIGGFVHMLPVVAVTAVILKFVHDKRVIWNQH